MITWSVQFISNVTNNHNYKRAPLSSMQRVKKQGKYPYYGAQGIIDYINDYIFEGEYLLIAEDGANLVTRNQNICRITKKTEKFWVNNHAHILTSNTKSDIRYLMYYLNHNDISSYITGSAQPKLNKANLGKIKILLPPIREQTAIANILSSFDNKVEINDEINKILENLAQALYKHWFVDFEFPNKEGKPYNSSGGKMIKSELGLIPEGWEIINLDEHLNFLRGVEPGARNYIDNPKEGYVPFYRVGDMIDNSKVKYIKLKLAKNRFINENNTVVSFDGAIGRVSIGLQGAYSTGIRKVFSKEELLSDQFIYVLFKTNSIQNTINEYANGTTILHASSSIKHLKMVYSKEVIENFDKKIVPIVDQIILNKNENIKLAEMRNLLLPKLMSGEIRIPIKE